MSQHKKDLIVIGRAEIETSELGRIAFEGDSELIMKMVSANDKNFWSVEGSEILHGAIYGKHLELAKSILKAGSPVMDSTYYIAFDFLPEFLDFLPSRPQLIEKIKVSRRWPAFNWAIVDGKVEAVQGFLREGVPINERLMITHGMGSLCPIHYAVQSGLLEMVVMIVNAGADVNALTDKGQSPLSLAATYPLLTRYQRRSILCFLRSKGARYVPSLSLPERLMVEWVGFRIKRD